MKERDDMVFLEHILESIEAIKDFSTGLTLELLHKNRLKRSAIVRELEIIGEASKNISANLKKKYKEIPWRQIAGTRDLIAHRYFGVNLEIVWDIVKEDILKLEKQLLKIKEKGV
jgi:uncharacterized protein with HEPN domain